jgi:hypothetical protein
MEYYEQLVEFFDKNGIDTNSIPEIPDKTSFSFSICGARNSVIFFDIWGDGIVNIWLGKFDDDSGGLACQFRLDNEKRASILLQLCKRFLISGRRKVLRRFENK